MGVAQPNQEDSTRETRIPHLLRRLIPSTHSEQRVGHLHTNNRCMRDVVTVTDSPDARLPFLGRINRRIGIREHVQDSGT